MSIKPRTYLFERIDGKLCQRIKGKMPYDIHRAVSLTAAEYAEYKRVKAEWRAMQEWVWGLEPVIVKADPKLKAEYERRILEPAAQSSRAAETQRLERIKNASLADHED